MLQKINKMQASGNDILQFIPQRAPIVMIDTLYYCTEQETKSGFTITKENIFCENNIFSESGLIENIAQTAALHAGALCKEKNIPAPIGFIGAVKNMEVSFYPKAGDRITTIVTIDDEIMGVTLISGKVLYNEKVAAKAEMKIVIKKS